MGRYIRWGIVIFMLAISAGYFWGDNIFCGINGMKNVDNSSKNIILKNEVLPTISKEIKILPNTNFGLKRKHIECNHISFEFIDLPTELINKTEDEVKNLYKDWKIEEFYENKVILFKEVDGICDEHFYITLGEEFVEIYKIIDKKESRVLYKTTQINKMYLAEEDIKKLEEGISIYGRDILSSVIEDFE